SRGRGRRSATGESERASCAGRYHLHEGGSTVEHGRMSAAIDSVPVVSGARPFIGHIRELRRDAVLALLDRATHEVDRVGRLRVFGPEAILLNPPDSIHALLVERARAFEKSLMIRFSLYPLAGEGLFTSRGELWRKQRRVMAPMFHPSKLAAFGPDMV